MRGDTTAARGRATGRGEGAAGLSPTLVAWLAEEPLGGRAVLDVGTGAGRLALHLAPRARRVLGIDIDGGALVEAQRHARRAGLANVLFVAADAEQADYRAFGQPDVVVAHLCMSDAIVARAGASLPPGGGLRLRRVPHRPVARDGPGVALRVRAGPRPRRAERGRAARRASRGGAGDRAVRVRGGGAGPGRRDAAALGGGRPLGGLGAVRRRGRADAHPEPRSSRWRGARRA